MKSPAASALRVLATVAVLGLIPAALAHGDDDMDMTMGASTSADEPLPDDQYAPTYFSLGEHTAAIYGHIGLMVAAWVFMLPVGKLLDAQNCNLAPELTRLSAVMLSLARSRYTLYAQFVFAAANAFGVLLGVVYNTNTPDLYPNNAHHKLGWIVTWVALAQMVIGLLGRVAGVLKGGASHTVEPPHERRSFIPVSSQAMEEHESRFGVPKLFRHSNDSGQGTEPGTESLRSHSLSSGADSPPIRDADKEYGDEEDIDLEEHDPLPDSAGKVGALRALAMKVAGKVSSRAWKILIFGYNFIDRTILILGFITLMTGIATFGRFFVSQRHPGTWSDGGSI
jgi:hypothetical protein